MYKIKKQEALWRPLEYQKKMNLNSFYLILYWLWKSRSVGVLDSPPFFSTGFVYFRELLVGPLSCCPLMFPLFLFCSPKDGFDSCCFWPPPPSHTCNEYVLLKICFKNQKSMLPKLIMPNPIEVSFASNERTLLYIPGWFVSSPSMLTSPLTFDMANSSGIQSYEIDV